MGEEWNLFKKNIICTLDSLGENKLISPRTNVFADFVLDMFHDQSVKLQEVIQVTDIKKKFQLKDVQQSALLSQTSYNSKMNWDIHTKLHRIFYILVSSVPQNRITISK